MITIAEAFVWDFLHCQEPLGNRNCNQHLKALSYSICATSQPFITNLIVAEKRNKAPGTELSNIKLTALHFQILKQKQRTKIPYGQVEASC